MPKNKYKISLVISMYNSKLITIKIIRKLLIDSIKKNVSKDVEIIILDDHSPLKKQTEKLVDELRQTRDIKFIRNNRNLGYTKSYNLGIKKAKGKYIIICNSDIRITPNSIESLTNVLRSNPRCGIVGPALSDIGANKYQYRPYNLKSLDKSELIKLDRFARNIKTNELKETDYLIGCFLALRMRTVKEIGLFDENFRFGYGEDIDYCIRTKNIDYSCLIDHSTFVYHFGRASYSQVPFKAIFFMGLNALTLLKKHRHLKFYKYGLKPVLAFIKRFGINKTITYFKRKDQSRYH